MPIPTDQRELERLASSFGALAHPTRLRVLGELRDGDALSPRRLAERVTPPTPLANVAHHVRELAARGIVDTAGTRPVRGALEHFYTLSPRGRELLEFVDRLADSDGGP